MSLTLLVAHSSQKGLRKRPVAIGEHFGWIRFLSRDVHKCIGQFPDSNREDWMGDGRLVGKGLHHTSLHTPCAAHMLKLSIFL